MALDFPASPITGQTYTGPGGIIWAWDGVKWVNGTQIGTAYAPIASPLFTGDPRSTTTPPPGDADTSLATTAFVAAAVAPAGNNAGRNLLHNALFNVAQRGTGPFTTGGYTLDRWAINLTTDTVSVTRYAMVDGDRTAVGDENAAFSLVNTFTGNAAAAAYNIIYQRIENVRRLAGKSVTVSFYASATVALKLGISYDQIFGTGGSPSAAVLGAGQAVSITTSWARYSVTLAIPSVSGKTLGTNGDDSTALDFWFSAGSSSATRAGSIGVQAGSVYLYGVQLEVGSVATPLDYGGSPQQQLAQCQRFYQAGKVMLNANVSSGGQYFACANFIVTPRAAPTIVVTTDGSSGYGARTVVAEGTTDVLVYANATVSGQAMLAVNYTASADL